jgi:hypothetical protein
MLRFPLSGIDALIDHVIRHGRQSVQPGRSTEDRTARPAQAPGEETPPQQRKEGE